MSSHSTDVLDRHVQIRTAGSFDFLSLYSRWKQFGSAGVCILHMLAFIVLWTLFVFEFGTFGILYISRQEVGGNQQTGRFLHVLSGAL